MKPHWENVYDSTPTDKLGWYEDSPQPSIDLINECDISKDARILNVGAGTSTLIDYLLGEGFENVLATDISQKALELLKERLGKKANKLEYIVDDLTNPQLLTDIAPVDLWHDRAVLHFFTEGKDQDTYFHLLKRLVKSGGYVIIAAFALTGAKMCSGLPVKNYSTEMLQEKLGEEFKLISEFDYLYTTPGGNPRDYIYTLFKRI